jgi:signal transduction histidine kinase
MEQNVSFLVLGLVFHSDAILGYQIRPQKSIATQSTTVHLSMIIIIILFFVGILNGIGLLLTFQTKATHTVGCAFYLLGSSITSILTVIIVTIKFCLLLYSQMNLISDEYFLEVHCILLDFFVRLFFTADNWLKACVAIERAITVIKGAYFNKQKSKKIVKWMISIVAILSLLSTIHDPIYRDLMHDEEEQRIWCIARRDGQSGPGLGGTGTKIFFRRERDRDQLFCFIGTETGTGPTFFIRRDRDRDHIFFSPEPGPGPIFSFRQDRDQK